MLQEGVVNNVGVDLDTHNGLGLLTCYIRASLFGAVSVFYTRHGFHVRVELRETTSYEDAINIRRTLGDCGDRLEVDVKRLERGADLARFDTLFEVRLKGGKTYSRREIDPLACGPYPPADV